MKKSRFTDSQVLAVLKQAEAGTPVPSLCREHGISSATFYKWRSKYGGMDASMMSQLKELQDENRRLKERLAVNTEILGRSPSIQRVRELVSRVAGTESTVLITGESGVGKERIAQLDRQRPGGLQHGFEFGIGQAA